MYKTLSGVAPKYISDLLITYSPQRTLRSGNRLLLAVPHFRCKTKGGRAFSAHCFTVQHFGATLFLFNFLFISINNQVLSKQPSIQSDLQPKAMPFILDSMHTFVNIRGCNVVVTKPKLLICCHGSSKMTCIYGYSCRYIWDLTQLPLRSDVIVCMTLHASPCEKLQGYIYR